MNIAQNPKPKTGANWHFALPVLLYFILGIYLALRLPHGDEILALNDLRRPPLNQVFVFFTHCGEFYAYTVAALAALFFGQKRLALLVALTGLLVMPVSFLAKDKFAETRPLTLFKEANRWQEVVTVPGVELTSGRTSFPSGHTTSAFALYSLLAFALPPHRQKWASLLALLAILVGISRVFLVQHFLVDILAGAALGLMLSSALWWIQLRIK